MRYTFKAMYELATEDIQKIVSLNYCNKKHYYNICQHNITYVNNQNETKNMLIDGKILAYWYIKNNFPVPEHFSEFIDEIKEKIKTPSCKK